MKILKILLIIVLIVIVVAGVALFVFIKTFDISKYKIQIVEQISLALNRDVDVDDIQLNYSAGQGLGLSVQGVVIPDNADFSSEPFLSVDSIFLSVDIATLISKRQLVISQITLQSPRIQVIRNPSGFVNVQTLISDKQESASTAESSSAPAPTSTPSLKKSAGLQFVMVKSIQIRNGAVTLVDQMLDPPLIVPIKNLNLQVDNFSLQKPFQYHLECSLWSIRRNLDITGKARIQANVGEVQINDVRAKIDLSQVFIEQLQDNFPFFSSLSRTNISLGQIDMTMDQMLIAEEGLRDLSFQGQYSVDSLAFNYLKSPLKDVQIQFEGNESEFRMSESINLASGKVDTSFQVKDYLKEQQFNFKLNIDDVQVAELIDQEDFPVKIEGIILGNFQGKGKGLDEPALQTDALGDGLITIKEGRILDVNVLKLLLSKIPFIPDLEARVGQNLPEEYKEKLNRKHTVITKGELKVKLENGFVSFDTDIDADGLLVMAKGKMDFQQNVEVSVNFYMNEDLSASLVAAEQELRLLQNEKGLIHIPLKTYRGKLENFKMYPDIGDLGRKVIQSKGRDELRKVLRKVLDIQVAPQPETGQPQEGAPVPEGQPELTPEEVIIESILDIIPIFR